LIALLRLLRLKPALRTTITQPEFIRLRKHTDIILAINRETTWDFLFSICRAFYAVMRLLRLADQKKPAMDMLKYYVMQADRQLQKYVHDIEKKYALLSKTMRSIMGKSACDGKTEDSNEDEDVIDSGEESEEEDEEDVEDEVEASGLEWESDEEDGGEKDEGSIEEIDATSVGGRILISWFKRCKKFLHDYALVGYMLSPNPTIREHAAIGTNTSAEDYSACERLITKLLIDKNIVGNELIEKQADLIDTFHQEYSDFVGKAGVFNKPHIWITAAKADTKAHEWHHRYSLRDTKVLGKLACLVLSKPVGNGASERSWKKVKHNKSKYRARTLPKRAKKQATIAGIHCAQKLEVELAAKEKKGELWEDKDFVTMHLDQYCLPIDELTSEEAMKQKTRIFCAWKESWEDKGLPSSGDPVIEARMLRKYAGLQWYDIDKDKMFVSHSDRMEIKKTRGKPTMYNIFAHTNEYDEDVNDDDQIDQFEIWEKTEDFFEMITEYYVKNKNLGVMVYQKGDIESENEDED